MNNNSKVIITHISNSESDTDSDDETLFCYSCEHILNINNFHTVGCDYCNRTICDYCYDNNIILCFFCENLLKLKLYINESYPKKITKKK